MVGKETIYFTILVSNRNCLVSQRKGSASVNIQSILLQRILKKLLTTYVSNVLLNISISFIFVM